MTTVAVIQPYFYPYAGYFRLFAAADVVVMFDCVQFPRRGWVHRNRFELATGELDWLTLPLVKAERDVRIDELRFSPDARGRLENAILRFPVLARARKERNDWIGRLLDISSEDVTSYLCASVVEVTATLGLERRTLRSSTLAIDPALRGQDRVIAVVRALGGTRYVNPSGGRDLYDPKAFAQAGLELLFLTPYEGRMQSVLSRLLVEPPDSIAAEIREQTAPVP